MEENKMEELQEEQVKEFDFMLKIHALRLDFKFCNAF